MYSIEPGFLWVVILYLGGYLIFFSIDRLSRLYRDDPHLKHRRFLTLAKTDKLRRTTELLKTAKLYEDWIGGVNLRTQSVKGSTFEISAKGSFEARILLKVQDPSGCVWGYEVWRNRGSWTVYPFELEGPMCCENTVDEYIHSCRTEKSESPWVVSVTGVYGFQIISESIVWELQNTGGL